METILKSFGTLSEIIIKICIFPKSSFKKYQNGSNYWTVCRVWLIVEKNRCQILHKSNTFSYLIRIYSPVKLMRRKIHSDSDIVKNFQSNITLKNCRIYYGLSRNFIKSHVLSTVSPQFFSSSPTVNVFLEHSGQTQFVKVTISRSQNRHSQCEVMQISFREQMQR